MVINSLKCLTVKKDKILEIALHKKVKKISFYEIFVQFTNFFLLKIALFTCLSNL